MVLAAQLKYCFEITASIMGNPSIQLNNDIKGKAIQKSLPQRMFV